MLDSPKLPELPEPRARKLIEALTPANSSSAGSSNGLHDDITDAETQNGEIQQKEKRKRTNNDCVDDEMPIGYSAKHRRKTKNVENTKSEKEADAAAAAKTTKKAAHIKSVFATCTYKTRRKHRTS